jgi:glycosyltransferase involved in cell wall biosynthesis
MYRRTPTLLSLNRFEKKKNAALAVEAFAILKEREPTQTLRLVLAGMQCAVCYALRAEWLVRWLRSTAAR